MAGGTPAASAEIPHGNRVNMKAVTRRHTEKVLHFAMAKFLQMVKRVLLP
jgi:hypothetical protein